MARETTTPNPEAPEGAMPSGALPGQITAPNPVEVFWEKHKGKVIAAALLGVGVYGASRWWEYQKRQERNETWSTVTTVTGLKSTYDYDHGMFFFGGNGPEKELQEAIEKKSPDEIEAAAARLKDSEARAFAYWFLARHYATQGDVDNTRKAIAKVAEIDPDFAGVVSMPAPPKYIEVPEVDPNDPESDTKEAKELRKNPPLPEAGKLSDQLIRMAEREAEFRKSHAALYTAPEPAEKPIVRLETTFGTIVLRFYPDKAPKHVEQFVKNIEEGVYDGLSFHRITRMGSGPYAKFMFEGKFAYLGDPETKQDDRSKWGQFKSENVIEGERSGVSHFPYMLGAEWNAAKKGSDTQIVYFTATDATKRDDKSVVFGRVVEGQDVIDRITASALSSTEENSNGSGIPATAITVEKATVEK
ncbi:MAG: peptidylprolyl isomerase [Planctomycetes bacterium]|nr:peptidylprolyl isomerase [Planctomycetota bacterium]MCB9891301.1 peptidylprolyl isomerase [Planctomycetota bacterium]MCB9919440.1 peptidylprolyl isomerase [Planctomycetota bacterium]